MTSSTLPINASSEEISNAIPGFTPIQEWKAEGTRLSPPDHLTAAQNTQSFSYDSMGRLTSAPLETYS